MNAQGLKPRAMDFMAPASSIERAVVVRSEALDGYFTQLVGDEKVRVVVFHQPIDYEAAVQRSTSVEAATPAIFVSDQALAEAKDEATFARAVAHAMAHVALMHRSTSPITQMATREAISPMIFMMGDGWSGYARRDKSKVTMRLLTAGYAKQNEVEAEQASVEILAGLHLDAAAFARAQAAVR